MSEGCARTFAGWRGERGAGGVQERPSAGRDDTRGRSRRQLHTAACPLSAGPLNRICWPLLVLAAALEVVTVESKMVGAGTAFEVFLHSSGSDRRAIRHARLRMSSPVLEISVLLSYLIPG